MNWTRTETLAMARQGCTYCWGLGLRPSRGGTDAPCHCVFRAIFSACLHRFRTCAVKEKYISRVSLESNLGRLRSRAYGMKNEEYMADFCLVAQRLLPAQAYQVFKFHFLLGADWKACAKRLGIDKGEFFHEVYRIESRLGRAYRELQPHPLFPLDEYFHGIGKQVAKPCSFLIDIEDLPVGSPIRKKRSRGSSFPLKAAGAA